MDSVDMIVPYEPFEPSPEAYARCSVLRDRLEKGGALRAAVVGAGVSGLAAARLLLAKGATVVVAADDVQHGKPAPDTFLLAARHMNVPADQCLVFEDAELGIQAAEAAGMKWVRVPRVIE